MQKITNYKRGFTLLELLVVIVIIGILATLVMGSFSGSQQQARDAKRNSDLRHYQTILQNYAAKRDGLYPRLTSPTVLNTSMCTSINAVLEPDADCPTDPNITDNYLYVSNNVSNAVANQYVVYARLEEKSGVSDLYAFYCSTGKSGTSTSVPNIGSCN